MCIAIGIKKNKTMENNKELSEAYKEFYISQNTLKVEALEKCIALFENGCDNLKDIPAINETKELLNKFKNRQPCYQI